MSWTLEGKAAIVTGASVGIGAEVVRQLVARGTRVAAFARRAEKLEALVRELGAERVRAVGGDLAVAADRERLVQEAEALGPVQVLVNNAGFGQKGPLELVDVELARQQFEVNVFGLMALTRQVLPAMRRAGGGRVLNVSSVAGRVAMPLHGWYCASKAALESLSDSLRVEVARFGIDVVLIEPGPIATEFFDVAASSLDHLSGDLAAYRSVIDQESASRRRAAGRRTTAAECAAVIVGAAAAPRPRARYRITALARALMLARWLLPTWVMDRVIARAMGVPLSREPR